ncbi:PLP-dependent transferase [Coemansia reversa NRRL 1564]|uniref:PLP-dependent transferase n=1 Tax=Coemansia reversa (strain ATCC 12441 / NRRL 1564) TaxID=763665 RepID=A0A2G5B142_COERN|nr:PLP-dependent transferase [Coemansia reversa NRRL 1564]|eukprot:PIA12738.1 PLP-dependent transferase [Coemansia reversa NRRL 1564]
MLLAEASEVLSEYVQHSQQQDTTIFRDKPPEILRQELDLSLFPEHGVGKSEIWHDVRTICATATNTWNSGFLYKLYAAPTPIGVVGETLLGVLNNNAHVFHASPAGTLIETAVAAKLAQLAGFPSQTAAGLTFPGGSYANLHVLMTARNERFPEIKSAGLCAVASAKPVVFTSCHAHYSIDKAAMAAGIGLDSVVHVPTDQSGCMDPVILRRMLQDAVDNGQTPFFVNATMGTTVLGACDPLDAIADICDEFKVWLHVDGSWGSPLALFSGDTMTPTFKIPQGRINSLTINPHKLLGAPLQCSFLLMRDGLNVMRRALGLGAGYLFHADNPDATDDSGSLDLGDATLGCGRRPDAVKFWLMWRYYGTQYFVDRLNHARRMALQLADMVVQRDPNAYGQWRLVSKPQSTCVCFWFVPQWLLVSGREGPDFDESLDLATRKICNRVNASGQLLMDYASVDLFKSCSSSDDSCQKTIDNLVKYTLPAFFRIPLNNPDVTKTTLVAVLNSIEKATRELYKDK